jgi:hypothetical protein
VALHHEAVSLAVSSELAPRAGLEPATR